MKAVILSLVGIAFRIVDLAVWAYVILSWIARSNAKLWDVYMWLARYIEPLLAPIRKLLEPLTYRIGLDFSPYLLAVLLSAVYRGIVSIVYAL